ncbi:endonuclease domain-containing protein [Candidatus Shapirobacteria bacterium]|nr:endonuclease domain-containing protein [Candidatus Shapirobacteria bacterium]
MHSERGVIRYWSELRDVARVNRKNPTKAEEKLWIEILKNKQTGYLFLRQKPIYRFIADFYCSELSLIIEVDGDSHDNKKGTDKLRDQWLECIGIKTIRFTNKEVLENIELVIEKLIPLLVKGGVRGGLKSRMGQV